MHAEKQIQNKIAQNITEQGYKDKYGINMLSQRNEYFL